MPEQNIKFAGSSAEGHIATLEELAPQLDAVVYEQLKQLLDLEKPTSREEGQHVQELKQALYQAAGGMARTLPPGKISASC